jgi:Cu+-exporting ATPase
VFDKTGTLTVGKPEVVASTVLSETTPTIANPLRFASAMARHSTHPLSQAVARLSPDDITFQSWRELSGSGVEAQWNDGTELAILRLGSLQWLRQSGVLFEAAMPFEKQWMMQGATLIGFSVNGKLAALIALRDVIKPGAAEVLRELSQEKLKLYLMTGDNEVTARVIAAQAGILESNVFAQIRPEQKAELICKMQERGELVAFVGDGINDAPALKQARLGIAVSQASDIAAEAADLVLLRSDIHAIPEAIRVARASLRTIKQNLFWAFFYNSATIPLAALGFLSPVICAATMGFSDVIVIGNALRLSRRRFSRK